MASLRHVGVGKKNGRRSQVLRKQKVPENLRFSSARVNLPVVVVRES